MRRVVLYGLESVNADTEKKIIGRVDVKRNCCKNQKKQTKKKNKKKYVVRKGIALKTTDLISGKRYRYPFHWGSSGLILY